MRDNKSAQNKSRFIGLRWKSFFWLSLLLLCLSAAFYALNYHALMRQYESWQQAEVYSLRHHIKGVFSGSSDRLMRLGGALATMTNLGEALKNGREDKISSIVSAYANSGYELDLRRIEIFTSDAQLVGGWGQFGAAKLSPDVYRQAIQKVHQQEKPLTLLHCQPLCLLYAFVPVLASGESIGVIALGKSIADLIIDFKVVTGTEIALIIPVDSGEDVALLNWRSRVPALTNTETLRPLLKYVSERNSDPFVFENGRLIGWDAKHYDVNSQQLNDIIPGQSGFILLLTDVSQRLHQIEKTLFQGLVTTLGSLIIAELILLYLIRTPLHRLGRLTSALPLLAEGVFDQARKFFNVRVERSKFRDEIDFLCESAMRLSHQLEANSRSIAEKNKELAEERDFIRGLLASAQVLIITQTKDGIIRVGNDFAGQMTGYTPDELYGKRFVELIADVEARPEVQDRLIALCNNDQPQMEHEHELVSKDGQLRKVMWVHTPLHEEYSDGTVLLSVGLDITERVQAESKMRWLANYDPLTGIINRHRFIEDLSKTFTEVLRTKGKAALLLFDLDHFKEINDMSGHAAGDALLRLIAEELKSRTRKSDIVARLGGDEFAVLMQQTDSFGAKAFAKELNERLSRTPFSYGEKRYRIGASIGIALLPQHGANAEEVLANADLAMFEAKRAGRSQARFFSYEMQQSEALTQNIYWKDILIHAMESEQLFFYYQPVVDVSTGKVVYSEALLRLRMDDDRVVAPGEFLPSAERAGLNYALDCYVAKLALKILLKKANLQLSINLSTAALNDSGWADPLIEAVYNKQLSSSRLTFEITETAVIKDMEKAKQITQKMVDLGFHFAVDDFGAGFSSLYYLKQLPVRYVKIDQSLIKDISKDQEDYDFVLAIISMIHVYGKKVVGEGIENAETLKLLEKMNVDLVQGYHIGYPDAECHDPAKIINY